MFCNQINEILNIKYLANEKSTNKKKENSLDSTSSPKKINNFQKNISNNILKYEKPSNLNNNKDELNNNKNNFTDYEINNSIYQEALSNDKRTFWQYYFSLLKTNHMILFSFYKNKDYNPKIIKICLFFFSFSLFLTINALFFNESKIHQIYKDKGKFRLISNIPQIIYIVLIFTIINNIFKRIFLSQKNILKIKNEKNKYNLKGRVVTAIKCLIIKFTCFFVISIVFLALFWYYLSCFCIVYRNTQIYLYKITLISFLFSLIYPFIIYLLPAFIRISSLKNPGECLYIISKIIICIY